MKAHSLLKMKTCFYPIKTDLISPVKKSIIEKGLVTSLEIVSMLRTYQLSNVYSLSLQELDRIGLETLRETLRGTLRETHDNEFLCLLELLSSLREEELIEMMRIFHFYLKNTHPMKRGRAYSDEPSPHDPSLFFSLRKLNMGFSRRWRQLRCTDGRFADVLWRRLKVIDTKFFGLAIQEDQMQTLINMLNMLSFYKFDSRMIASTSTIAPTIAPFTPYEKDKKWHLKPEVLTLFNRALEATFPHFKEKCMMFCSKNDFQCDNVVSIWPKIKKEHKNYPDITRPTDVGERIKNGLVELKSPLIEGEPYVYGVGFVKIKLSGNWMAENIHKMLRDGIDIWAPRQQLDFRSTIVSSPSWDEFNLKPIDVLRRQLIIMSRMHMLEYVNCAAATTYSGNRMWLPRGKFDDHFWSVEKEGKLLVYIKDGNKLSEPIIRGKSRKTIGLIRDGCSGYPLEDLAALWHGIKIKKADWIMCVAPSQQQDYIESCFNAAELAGWTTDSLWPLATYVGFKTCSASLEDLLSFLFKAQYPREAGEAAKLLGYTYEAVLDCALMYTFLKYHRLEDCTFSYNEMFDVKGDTFVHLITTQAQICKITDHSRKDIDDLKKDSKLVLEEDKVIWCEGVERELGFHLLMFTEMIQESYLCFFPHLVCRYLYNLSEKFNCFYESYASLGFKEKTKLLLCEATAVVMEKGFQLLGITKKPSLQALSVALTLNYVAPLETSRNPLTTVNIGTRFEVFTAYIDITRDPEFKDGKLFGWIGVTDYYGLRPDGWGSLRTPGPGCVNLLSRDCLDPVKIRNSGRLKIGNPSSQHSVPFSSCMRIAILIYATTENNDEFFEVCNHSSHMNFLRFLKDKSVTSSCEYLVAKGADGHIRINYILLKDAVDATIKVKLDRVSDGRRVCGVILAYYDNFDYGDDKLVKSFYKALLYEESGSLLEVGDDVPLTRSILAVPITGSLIIEARLTDFESGEVVLNGHCVFCSKSEGSFKGNINNEDYTLEVEISWSRD